MLLNLNFYSVSVLFQFYFETIDFKKIGDIITIKFPN